MYERIKATQRHKVYLNPLTHIYLFQFNISLISSSPATPTPKLKKTNKTNKTNKKHKKQQQPKKTTTKTTKIPPKTKQNKTNKQTKQTKQQNKQNNNNNNNNNNKRTPQSPSGRPLQDYAFSYRNWAFGVLDVKFNTSTNKDQLTLEYGKMKYRLQPTDKNDTFRVRLVVALVSWL